MQIPSQKIITKDNVSIDIAAVAYYHISDPERSVIVIENVYNAINQISQTTVRNVVGRFSLDQLLSDTASINEQIKNVIDGHTEPWGTQVTAVEIKDITLPDNMQRAMAKEAEAERERRAKIVAAEGEYQAAVKLGAGGRHHHAASRGAAASHAADDGRNCDRKEFNHHLPRTIHDDGAGSDRNLEQGCGLQITPYANAGHERADRRLSAEAVRLRHCAELDRIGCARMQVMQEDGELLSHGLAMRRHGFLEQMVLKLLRQPAPNSCDTRSQDAKSLLLSLSGKQV